MAAGKPVKQLLSFKHHLQLFQGNAAKWIVCCSMPSQVDYLLQGIDGQACQPFVTICIIYVVILMCHPFITKCYSDCTFHFRHSTQIFPSRPQVMLHLIQYWLSCKSHSFTVLLTQVFDTLSDYDGLFITDNLWGLAVHGWSLCLRC